jgi:ribosomal protein L20
MSARLSLGRKRGRQARPIWVTGMSWIAVHVQLRYSRYLEGMLRRRVGVRFEL